MEALLIIAGIAWLIHASSPKARARRKAKFYKRCFPNKPNG